MPLNKLTIGAALAATILLGACSDKASDSAPKSEAAKEAALRLLEELVARAHATAGEARP